MDQTTTDSIPRATCFWLVRGTPLTLQKKGSPGRGRPGLRCKHTDAEDYLQQSGHFGQQTSWQQSALPQQVLQQEGHASQQAVPAQQLAAGAAGLSPAITTPPRATETSSAKLR
jgi:hypothetical protein